MRRRLGRACALLLFAADVRAGRHATEAEFARVLDEEQAPASRAEEFGAPEGIVEAFEQLDGDTSCG